MSEPDRESYAYRFGALAMQARLFLCGQMQRGEFVRLVNAASLPELEPISVAPQETKE